MYLMYGALQLLKVTDVRRSKIRPCMLCDFVVHWVLRFSYARIKRRLSLARPWRHVTEQRYSSTHF